MKRILRPVLQEPAQRDGVNNHDQEIGENDGIAHITYRECTQRFVDDLKREQEKAD